MKRKLAFIMPIVILISSITAFKLIYKATRITSETVSSNTRNSADNQPSDQPLSQTQSTTPSKPLTDSVDRRSIRIMATGDILLGRGVKFRLQKLGKEYTYPFEGVAAYLKKGDIVFGNLEAAITSSEHSLAGIDVKGGKYVFKNDPEAIEGIKYAGFNILNLANNHILDYYETGLFDTLDILDKNGIAHIGAGKNLDEARKPAIIEKNGLKVGILGYSEMADVVYKGDPPLSAMAGKDKAGISPKNLDYIKEDIVKLRPNVDIILVSLHWGIEYTPTLAFGQQEFAHEIIDAGADAIIGHHPHQIKGMEIYKGKPVLYSLGNFLSDQNDPENLESFFVDMTYTGNKISSLEAIPFKIVNKSQVVPITDVDAEQLLHKLERLSLQLGSKCRIKDGKVIFDFQ